MTLGTILLIILILLILLLIGAIPDRWLKIDFQQPASGPYGRAWGYGPSGLLGVLLIVLIALAGRI